MLYEFKLPDIGEGVVEGEIVKWLIKEGDLIEEDQPMVEVMTDKATITIPSPHRGRVLKTIGKEGEIIKVGSTMVIIETAEEAKPQAAAAVSQIQAPEASRPQQARRVLATPATRKLARELGVDLASIEGTGPEGRVTREDVLRYLERPTAQRAEAKAPSALEERIPFRGLRRKIAEKMVKSKSTAPHFTYVEEADVTDLVALRSQAERAAAERGVKLTYLPFIIKALIASLKKYPILNATLDEDAGQIVIKKYYNIGIAVATEGGLMVPVIKDADRKSILELAGEIERLAEEARTGKIKLEDLQGGTFTITSLGPLGGILATPIINYPEVAILGVHRIHKRPVVRENSIAIRDMVYLSLSLDHRVVDGAVGAQFAHELIRYLENPHLLLMQMV